MNKLFLLLIVGFISVSLAQEYPVTNSNSSFFNYDPNIFDQEENSFRSSGLPVWAGLENLSLSERENSTIDIEHNQADAFVEIFNRVTNLWNTGKYEEALNLFKTIDAEELKTVAVGIHWKVPIPTADHPEWGTDVRIGNRDSIEVVSLTYEKSTGKLFAVLVYTELGSYYYSMNLSIDGGATWSETFTYSAGGAIPIVSVSAAVVASHCYVGYAYDGAQTIGRLRRFTTSDGAFATFPDASNFVSVFSLASTDSVEQVVVNTNQTDFNNRLYYTALTKSDSIKAYWNNPTTVTYNSYINAFTDAETGLDMCRNNGYTGAARFYNFGSYITTAGAIKTFGVTGTDSLVQLTNLFGGSVNDHSSISAQNDTITSVFEYSSSTSHNRYIVSYNGGTNWFFGLVGDTLAFSERPDIAAGDGGVGIIYRYYTPTRQGRFVWRPLVGTWSSPVQYTDHEPYFNKPAIEYLGNKKFGIVYLSWFSPALRGAYFDLNNMAVGVNDELTVVPSDFGLMQNYPNPFNPSTLIRYQIPVQSFVTIKIYDALGNLISTLVNEEKPIGQHEVNFNADNLASGVYFYSFQAGAFVQTQKMVLVR